MIKKILLLLYGLLSPFLLQAQSPGGVSGASLWLRADAGVSGAAYFNVAAGSRTASSNYSGLDATNSTLGSGSSWSAASASTGVYLTLDLGSSQTVRGVVTKGRGDGAQWVTSYTVSYSSDNVSYTSLGSFTGNSDQNTEVTNLFTSSINARYIRFTVTGYSTWPSMRADVVQTLSSVTTDNSTITAWLDQSGLANNAVQATSSNQPLFKNNLTENINFNPVVNVGGSRYVATSNNISASDIFSVQYPDKGAIGGAMNGSPCNNFYLHGLYTGGITYTGSNNTSFLSINSLPSFIVSGKPVISHSALTGVSGTGKWYGNGFNMGASDWTGTPTPFVSRPMGIGKNVCFDSGVQNLPEIIMYNFNLNTTQRSQVNTYLAIKYGITLNQTVATDYLASNGTTILWNATTNTGYNNNIAGIGRDDMGGTANSGLNQKQSQSVNSGSQVVMALGTAAASNQANANTIASDKQFFTWGDDNGSLTTQVATGNSNYLYRFTRIWKTQNTGSFAQNITVYYPVSAFGSALPVTVALLYGTSTASLSNGTASAIAQSGTTSINGVSHYAFTVPSAQVVNMQFFSFTGVIQTAPGGVFTNLSLWLRADAGTTTTTNNTTTTSWTNQAPGGSASSGGNGATYLSNSYNFNPGISFNGSNNNFTFTTGNTFGVTGTSNVDMFSVAQTNIPGTFTPLISGSITGQLQYAFNAFGTINGNTVLDGTPTSDKNLHLYGVRRTGGSTNQLFVEGKLDATNSNGHSFPGGGFVGIGYWAPYNSQFVNGSYNEAIIYGSGGIPSTTDVNKVNSYLAIKYGLTLGSISSLISYTNTAGVTTWTGSATYQNNIAGIGRDDISALHQKQSQSVNSGSQVVMALGNVAASNQANTNMITSDKQFFIWGDDNGSLSSIVPTGNSTYSYRFTRVWKTQNTGSFNQDITVYYPVSAFGNALSTTVALLYGTSAASLSNGTATAIGQSGTTTINGASYYVFTVPSAQVANMQFFSFTDLQTAPGGVFTNLGLWLKADRSVSLSSGKVSTWNNLVTNSSITQQATNTGLAYNITLNANSLNFNPGITFPGSPNNAALLGLNNAGLWDGQLGVFTTVKGISAPAGAGIFSSGSKGMSTSSGSGIFLACDSDGGAPSYSIPIGTGALLGNANYNSNSTSGTSFFSNGYNYNLTGGGLNPSTYASFEIGSRVYFNNGGGTINNRVLQGDIPEVIVYNRDFGLVANASDRARINSYLAIKYGVTLDQTVAQNYIGSDGTTIFWNATTNTGYNNNIAGIGRDDISALYQKQSQSQNSGSHVVMALGTVAASNQANANTITSDKQFFIWGDDNGSLSSIVPTGNSTYSYRFTRVWKTQNTGSFNQDITVYYPVSAFGNALSTTVALLYGTSAASLSNGTATAIGQSGTTTINGASYYVFTVPSAQVANMQFFSFTDLQTAPGGVFTNLGLWLKADRSVSLSSGKVSTWNNLVTNSSITQQATNTGLAYNITLNANSLNFNPGITFPGSPNNAALLGLNNAGLWDGQLGVFTTVKGISAPAGAGIFSSGSKGMSTSSGSGIFLACDSDGGAPSYSIPIGTGALLGNANYNSNSTSGTSFFSNGYNYNLTGGGLNPSTYASFEIGSRVYFNNGGGTINNRVLQGDIPEVIVYNRDFGLVANASDRARINSYLAIKYGVTLDQTVAQNYIGSDGTTIFWNATTNTGYNNNIAGIGRDDISALYQKQSQSQNSGSHVVMALGTVAASNQANANTITSDKQFFIWGDDNGSLSTFVSTGNITYPSRFTRIWKTQNTGTFAQNMTVYYPVSAFGNASSTTVALLYGTSAVSLSNGSALVIPQSGTTTINGVSYYVFTVPSAQVANIQFFSFTGSSICYKPAVTVGTTLDTKHGITSLSRAGTSGDNWPMVRKGAWTVLESKTKGFVINRLTAAQIAAIRPENLIEGMMVYDTTNNRMKVYTSTDGGATFNWQSISTQTCPD